MTNPSPLTLEHPLDVDDARRAARRLSEQRREAEEQLQKLSVQAAEAEAQYRRALARAFIEAKGETAAQREASARAEVADKSFARDIAHAMAKVQTERLRGLEGERSMLKSLMDWSARMNLDAHTEHGLRQAA